MKRCFSLTVLITILGVCSVRADWPQYLGPNRDATSDEKGLLRSWPGGPIEKLVKTGRSVLAVDLRGTGETQQTGQRYFMSYFGSDGQDVYTAYLLGRSYVGMRTEDILICARFLQQQDGRVDLVAVGHVSVPALHAAALESDMFGSIKLLRGLVSWSNVIESGRSLNQLVNTVHGALTVYDLPDLAATLGDKLTIEEPLNALGEPMTKN